MKIASYIGFKVVAFIPVIWITYILRPTYFPEFPIRFLICLIILNFTISKCEFLIKKNKLVFNQIKNDGDYLRYTNLPISSLKRVFNYINISFGNYASVISLFIRYDIFKGVIDMLLIILFISFVNGNPFLNKYVGFVEPVQESAEEASGNPNKSILYRTKVYDRLNNKSFFEYYRDLELDARHRSFIFRETAVLNDFPREYGSPKPSYLQLTRTYFIGLLTSLIEAIIKSTIWVTLIYLIAILISKEKRLAIQKMM